MIQKFIICDKCKKELPSKEEYFKCRIESKNVDLFASEDIEKELCKKCLKKLNSWFKE